MTSPHAPWDSLQFELLHIYDADVLPWGRKVRDIPPANYHRAWLLRAGSGRARIGKHWHAAVEGEWMVPSPALSAQEFSGDARLLSLHFRARWPDGSPLFDIGSVVRLPHLRYPELEAAATSMLGACPPSASLHYGSPVQPVSASLDQHLLFAASFRQWLRFFCSGLSACGIAPGASPVLDHRVRAGLQWLNDFPLNARFREPELAARLGLSVTHLNRLFARELKTSPVAHLERRRWERAVDLLTHSSLSSKEIAFDLGFCAPSYFTSWFKARCGQTPLAYRRRMR